MSKAYFLQNDLKVSHTHFLNLQFKSQNDHTLDHVGWCKRGFVNGVGVGYLGGARNGDRDRSTHLQSTVPQIMFFTRKTLKKVTISGQFLQDFEEKKTILFFGVSSLRKLLEPTYISLYKRFSPPVLKPLAYF